MCAAKADTVVVLGPLSVLSFWGFDVGRTICALSREPIAVYNVDRNGPIATPGMLGARTFLISHFPTQEVLDRASSPNSRAVIFLDDPVHSVRYVQTASGC